MDRAQTIALLGQHQPELQRHSGVLRLALFGSRARDRSQDGSDTDAAPPREWRFYVEGMLACCDKVLANTKGIDRAGFAGDPMRYEATLRNLERSTGRRSTSQPAPASAG